jgi:hypothetical protein
MNVLTILSVLIFMFDVVLSQTNIVLVQIVSLKYNINMDNINQINFNILQGFSSWR